MTRDDILDLCSESYIVGQKNLLEMMIEAAEKTKTIGQAYVSLDEVLRAYDLLLKQINYKLKLIKRRK